MNKIPRCKTCKCRVDTKKAVKFEGFLFCNPKERPCLKWFKQNKVTIEPKGLPSWYDKRRKQ